MTTQVPEVAADGWLFEGRTGNIPDWWHPATDGSRVSNVDCALPIWFKALSRVQDPEPGSSAFLAILCLCLPGDSVCLSVSLWWFIFCLNQPEFVPVACRKEPAWFAQLLFSASCYLHTEQKKIEQLWKSELYKNIRTQFRSAHRGSPRGMDRRMEQRGDYYRAGPPEISKPRIALSDMVASGHVWWLKHEFKLVNIKYS